MIIKLVFFIISRFKKRVKKEVSPSLVYPFLQQLEEKGLVTHTQKPVGEKERKVFELTQSGRELCIDHPLLFLTFFL